MKPIRAPALLSLVLFLALAAPARLDDVGSEVKEQTFDALNGVKVRVRMEGPYTADAPLQVVCYFRYTPEGVKRMTGAPVELDKRLGGVIGSLRERGEFAGDELETLLLIPSAGSIKAKTLLLIGLGADDKLSLPLLERVGRIAAREAARLGTTRVAFAPLIRDQGNSKLPTGEVAAAVLRGVLLADDTDRRLQKEGLARPFALQEWIEEAGPAYFGETAAGVQRAISDARTAASSRSTQPYRSQGRP